MRTKRGRYIAAAALAVAAVVSGGFALVAVLALFAWRWLWRRRPRPLHGRVVVITSATSGRGIALAEECVRLGARAVLCAGDEHEMEAMRARLLKSAAPDASSTRR